MTDTEVFIKEVRGDSVVVVLKEVGPPSMNPTSKTTEFVVQDGHTITFPVRNVYWGPDGYVSTGRVVITNNAALREAAKKKIDAGGFYHPPAEWFN